MLNLLSCSIKVVVLVTFFIILWCGFSTKLALNVLNIYPYTVRFTVTLLGNTTIFKP